MTETAPEKGLCSYPPYTPSLSPTVKHEAPHLENTDLYQLSEQKQPLVAPLVLIEQVWKHNCYAYCLNHATERRFDTFLTVFVAVHLWFYSPEVTSSTLTKNVNTHINHLSVSIFASLLISFMLEGVKASFLTLWVLMLIIVKELLVEIMSCWRRAETTLCRLHTQKHFFFFFKVWTSAPYKICLCKTIHLNWNLDPKPKMTKVL